MKIFTILVILFCTILTFEAKPQDDFWDRVNVGIIGGPLFPSGDDAEVLSTGYYVGIEARYQIFRFMAVGFSIGRNSWSGSFEESEFAKTGSLNQLDYSSDISSSKTNVSLSFHFGPSAPTWGNITASGGDISDVKPYQPGMFVPFFIFDIGPYFYSWTQEDEFETTEETGSDVFIRGTAAGFYQVSDLISLLIGLSYSLYEFGTDFTAVGILGGIRFNMGQLINSNGG